MAKWHTHKQKNWQWRMILAISLFLIFGKSFGNWVYNLLGVEKFYATTTEVVRQAGLNEFITGPTEAPISSELIIDVKNDTPNDYTIETKVAAGHIDAPGQTFSSGEIKRFTVKPYEKINSPVGRGDIIFLSAPLAGNNNQTCQEVHTLNYDLKYADRIKQPVTVNLSTIDSKMECRNNSAE